MVKDDTVDAAETMGALALAGEAIIARLDRSAKASAPVRIRLDYVPSELGPYGPPFGQRRKEQRKSDDCKVVAHAALCAACG